MLLLTYHVQIVTYQTGQSDYRDTLVSHTCRRIRGSSYFPRIVHGLAKDACPWLPTLAAFAAKKMPRPSVVRFGDAKVRFRVSRESVFVSRECDDRG